MNKHALWDKIATSHNVYSWHNGICSPNLHQKLWEANIYRVFASPFAEMQAYTHQIYMHMNYLYLFDISK